MLFNGINYSMDDLRHLMALGDHNTASMLFDEWPEPDEGFETVALAALASPATWMGADADEWLHAADMAADARRAGGPDALGCGVRLLALAHRDAHHRIPMSAAELEWLTGYSWDFDRLTTLTARMFASMDDEGERARLAGILHEATERRLRQMS